MSIEIGAEKHNGTYFVMQVSAMRWVILQRKGFATLKHATFPMRESEANTAWNDLENGSDRSKWAKSTREAIERYEASKAN